MTKYFVRAFVISMLFTGFVATAALAQQPLLGTTVGDQFVFSWRDFVGGKGESGYYTLTYVGKEGVYHAYKSEHGRKALITEDGQARQTRGSFSDATIYSPYKGLRPPGDKGGQSWTHNHHGGDGEGKRYMDCTSRTSGPYEVGNIRFEETVTSVCVDQRAGALYPQTHEVIWARGIPFPLHERRYWEGTNPDNAFERSTKMEKMFLRAPGMSSLIK